MLTPQEIQDEISKIKDFNQEANKDKDKWIINVDEFNSKKSRRNQRYVCN